MTYNLGFVGGGNMSTAIVQGIIKNGTHPPSRIWVSGPHVENLKHWEEMGATTTDKNSELFKRCDVIILGVKPVMLKEAVIGLLDVKPSDVREGDCKLIISMLAGVDMVKLEQEFEPLLQNAKVRIIRIMPNMPMTVGHGVCLYTLGANATKEDGLMVEKLLAGSCITEKVTETIMGTLGVLTACGPAMVYMVIEALSDGAVKQGVPRAQALKFAAQTLIGSGQMVLQTGKHPAVLKDEVCSPGGTTICAVSALENGNVRASFINAIEAATLKTLGKK